ncbi:hypothetical protein TPA0909_44100 [Streptomyces albus]|nr:hypothetical protein TPA0909_44100 [Streptomyces albus]
MAAGAPAPMIATALLAEFDGPVMVAVYVIAAALLTVVALACAAETSRRDLAAVGGDGPGDGGEASLPSPADGSREPVEP